MNKTEKIKKAYKPSIEEIEKLKFKEGCLQLS